MPDKLFGGELFGQPGGSSPPPPPPPPGTGVWVPGQVEWVFWLGREGLTHRVLAPLGSYTPATLSMAHPYAGTTETAVAKRRLPTVKEQMASSAVYTGQTLMFLVPTGAFGTAPKPGDKLRDSDSIDHTILEAWKARTGLTWHLRTIALALVANLRSSGVLKRPANTAAADGKRVPGLATLTSNIPCRVQRQDASRDDAYDAPANKTRAIAYLGQQVFPELGDVFVADGVTWGIDGWRSPDRLDVLMELDLSGRD